MERLAELSHLEVDWELGPEEAVLLYMDHADGNCRHFPVNTPEETVSRYFVVDTWESVPVVRFLERSTEWLKQLAVFPVPEEFRALLREPHGLPRGMVSPPEALRAWLKEQMGQ